MPMANRMQHSQCRLELFQSSTRSNQRRYWDEPSGGGTQRTAPVRRSVLLERWRHVPEAEDRQDAFDDFLRWCPALILRITGKDRMPATLSADRVDAEELWHLHQTAVEMVKTINLLRPEWCSWMTCRGCAAAAHFECRKPAAGRRPVWCGSSLWFPAVNWNHWHFILIILRVLSWKIGFIQAIRFLTCDAFSDDQEARFLQTGCHLLWFASFGWKRYYLPN